MTLSKSLVPVSVVLLLCAASLPQSAFAQTCQTRTGAVNDVCLEPGATCAATPAPPGPGMCTTGAQAGTQQKCNCLDAAGKLIPAGAPVAPPKPPPKKGAGPGLEGLALVLGLIGLSWLWSRRPRRS
jgi:hypothetical protein